MFTRKGVLLLVGMRGKDVFEGQGAQKEKFQVKITLFHSKFEKKT